MEKANGNGNNIELGKNGLSAATAAVLSRSTRIAPEQPLFNETETLQRDPQPDSNLRPDQAAAPEKEENTKAGAASKWQRGTQIKWLIVAVAIVSMLLVGFYLLSGFLFGTETKRMIVKGQPNSKNQAAPASALNPDNAAQKLTTNSASPEGDGADQATGTTTAPPTVAGANKQTGTVNQAAVNPNNGAAVDTSPARNIFIQSPEANTPVTTARTALNGAAGQNQATNSKPNGTAGITAQNGHDVASDVSPTARQLQARAGGAAQQQGVYGNGNDARELVSETAALPSSATTRQSSYFLFDAPPVGPSPASESLQSSASSSERAMDKTTVALTGVALPAPGAPAANRPPFGTMLPLQTLGAIDTLRQSAIVRMVLTRPVSGAGYSLPAGTIFVGTVSGGVAGRAFVQVNGYLDASRNSFVRVKGDVTGVDGAAGLQGETKHIGSRWGKVVKDLGNKAYTTANTLIGRLGGGNQTNIQLPTPNDMGFSQGNTQQSTKYVRVAPGSYGYLTITELPAEAQDALLAPLPGRDLTDVGDDTTGETSSSSSGQEFLSDAEVIDLLSRNDEREIRANLSRIGPRERRSVLEVIGQNNKARKE